MQRFTLCLWHALFLYGININCLCADPSAFSRHLPVREDEVTGRQMPSNRSMKEVAVAMNLCVLCIVFVACWTPGNLVYFLPRALIWMKRVFFGVAIGDSCLNFFIYAAMNRAFRESYVHIVRCVLTCKWSNIVE